MLRLVDVKANPKTGTYAATFALNGKRLLSLVVRPEGRGVKLDQNLGQMVQAGQEIILLENQVLAGVEKSVLEKPAWSAAIWRRPPG